MKIKSGLRAISVSAWLFVASTAFPMLHGCGGGDLCCKVCDIGKACGDTCIEATKTCETPSGCACNK